MVLSPVNNKEVVDAIKALKTNSAPGIDEIPVRVIKDAANMMVPKII